MRFRATTDHSLLIDHRSQTRRDCLLRVRHHSRTQVRRAASFLEQPRALGCRRCRVCARTNGRVIYSVSRGAMLVRNSPVSRANIADSAEGDNSGNPTIALEFRLSLRAFSDHRSQSFARSTPYASLALHARSTRRCEFAIWARVPAQKKARRPPLTACASLQRRLRTSCAAHACERRGPTASIQ